MGPFEVPADVQVGEGGGMGDPGSQAKRAENREAAEESRALTCGHKVKKTDVLSAGVFAGCQSDVQAVHCYADDSDFCHVFRSFLKEGLSFCGRGVMFRCVNKGGATQRSGADLGGSPGRLFLACALSGRWKRFR